MLIGLINIKIFIPSSTSLKDKRRVIKSLIVRIRNKFNVSIAEIADLDEWQVAEIGLALIGNETKIIHQQISQIVNFLEKENDFDLVEIRTQIL